LLAKQNKDILLIDADDQATSRNFMNFRSEMLKNIEYTVIKLSDKAIRDQTLKLKNKYDHIIICKFNIARILFHFLGSKDCIF